jgi:ECF sigma factor
VSEVTRILDRVQQGEAKAAEELPPLVYDELRTLAAHKMAHEAPGQTQELEEHAPWRGALCRVSSDGRLLAYYRTNEQVRVWDTATKKAKSTVQLPAQHSSSLTFEFSARFTIAGRGHLRWLGAGV